MSWRSDELHHRSAERSGWCAELRAADPDAVDESVDGAVEYAAKTGPRADGGTNASDQPEVVADQPGVTVDPTTVAGSAETAAERASGELEATDDTPVTRAAGGLDERDCAFCADPVPDDEALDAAGAPLPADSGFEWVGDVSPHHKECLPDGEGRFLPWTANGVLGDDGAE